MDPYFLITRGAGINFQDALERDQKEQQLERKIYASVSSLLETNLSLLEKTIDNTLKLRRNLKHLLSLQKTT